MITSFFPGRVRLRAPVFKDGAIVERCRQILSQSDAVMSVEANPRTGSVLLEYDPDRVPVDRLQPLTPFFLRLQDCARCYDGRQRGRILAMLDELDGMVKGW